MSVSVLKRPYSYCFSGNPVYYELFSSLAATDNTVQIELRVKFKTIGGAYSATDAIPFAPVNGSVKADIADILESLLTYELPTFENDTALQAAAGHTGEFYLQFREVSALNQDTTWDDSDAGFSCLVLKGGLSRFKYQGNNFWVNYFNVKKPFLTWQQSGRKAALDERLYLLFLNTVEADSIKAVAKVYFIDGTTATTERSAVVPKNQCVYIPAGAAQWNLQSLAPKIIWYWEISVYAGTQPLSETFRFEQDNRNDYNETTLHYRGSLGGLDSVRVRGDLQQELSYEFQKLAVTQRPDYYNGSFYTPQQRIAGNKEQQTWSGDIGHLEKEEQDRMRDVFLQRETWWAVHSKWWPVNITTTKATLRKTSSKLFSFPIEWTLAHDGDPYYTPFNMDVGTAVFESNVCQAFVSDISITLEENIATPGFKKATITFTENDPQDASIKLQYRFFSDDLEMPWTEHNYAPIEILVEENKITTLELQGICSNAILGKKIAVQIDTNEPPPPDDGGEIDPRTAHTLVNNSGSGFNYTVKLGGVVQSTGFVAPHSTTTFLANVASATTLELDLDSFSPSTASLTGTFNYNGVIVRPNKIIFTNVTSTNYGVAIN